MGTKLCEGCGIEIQAKRSTRRFCGECGRLRDKLAAKRYEQRQRNQSGLREPGSVATCQWCNSKFLAKRSDAKTCSKECIRLRNLAKARRFEASHRGTCKSCGVATSRRYQTCHKCSQPERIAKLSGANNYAWKGGRSTSKRGYVHILVAPEKRKGHRYRPEHILVWETANGPIPEGHIVHHINGIKNDNRLENLEVISRSEHRHRHGEQRIAELEAEARALRARIAELEE